MEPREKEVSGANTRRRAAASVLNRNIAWADKARGDNRQKQNDSA